MLPVFDAGEEFAEPHEMFAHGPACHDQGDCYYYQYDTGCGAWCELFAEHRDTDDYSRNRLERPEYGCGCRADILDGPGGA